MKTDIIVFIGQLAAGKTTVGRLLASSLRADFKAIEDIRGHIHSEAPEEIADAVDKDTTAPIVIFECSGTSDTFEQLVAQLEAKAERVFVIKLLCTLTTALNRVQTRKPWRLPLSGTSWRHEILRSEQRLRRVPADLTLDTTLLNITDIPGIIKKSIDSTQWTSQGLTTDEGSTDSFSKLALSERCHLAYEFKHIEKIPELFLSEKTLLGQFIHKSLSELYLSKTHSQEVTLDQVLDDYNEALCHLPPGESSHGLQQSLQREGGLLLQFHYDFVYQHDQLTTWSVEHDFCLHLGKSNKIAGRIDRVAQSEAEIPIVIDYKTGSERISYLSEVPDLLQLEVYAYAMLVELKVNAVEVRRHSVRTGREECYGVTIRDLPRIRASIVRWIQITKRRRYPESKPGKICTWCAYNPICELRSAPHGPGLLLSRGD